MKRRALTPAISLILLATALGGCRVIPESSAPPPPAPVQERQSPPPYQPPSREDEAAEAPDPLPDPPPRQQQPYRGPPLAYTRIGETVYVDGPKVTPLSLIEDSRCAQGVQCVWAGRLRVRVRVDLGSGSRDLDMTLGEPVQVADGQLELLDALPKPLAGGKPAPFAYQLGFRFSGGI